jgi:LAGLIDADG endonuclease
MKKLDFWYITGLADAENSFVVNIIKDDTRSTGYNTHGSFELNLNYKDKRLLENIKYTLGVGNIFYNSNDKTYKF